MTQIFNIETNPEALKVAQLLRDNPGASYMDLFGTPDGDVVIGGVTLPNHGQALNAPATYTLNKVEALNNAEEKIRAAVARIEDTRTKLDAQLLRNAQQAIKKIPGGPEQVAIANYMYRLSALDILPNPYNAAGGIKQQRAAVNNKDTTIYMLRICGSLVLRRQPGETDDALVNRARSVMYDHRATLAAVFGIEKVGEDSTVAYAVKASGSLPGQPDVEKLSVLYGIRIVSIKSLGQAVNKVEAFNERLQLLNPLVADNDTLQLNSDEFEQLERAQEELAAATLQDAEVERRDERVEHLEAPSFEPAAAAV